MAVSEKSAINHCPGVKKSPSPVPPPPSPPSPGQGERERDRNRSKSIDAEKRNRKKISEPLDAALQSLRGRKVWTVNQIPRVTGVGSKSQQVEVEFTAARRAVDLRKEERRGERRWLLSFAPDGYYHHHHLLQWCVPVSSSAEETEEDQSDKQTLPLPL